MEWMLGIETSCDDTSVAVVGRNREIRANLVSSQIEEHAPFLGVVPELAGRAHLQSLPIVYEAALDRAGLGLEDLTAIAVTSGPGLIGSLMVGINFAKALAFGKDLPLIGVNHIRGHVAALFLEFGELPLPALGLIVSGGHTHLLEVGTGRALTLLAKTRDDAAGEAFDKLSKMLGLGFPGGPLIDRLAQKGKPDAFSFSFPRFSDGSKDYSFSGVKTAAARIIESDPRRFADREGQGIRDLCASFQAAVVHQLLHRVRLAMKRDAYGALLLGGGVARNSGLRAAFRELGTRKGVPALITSPKLSTDNAAMIAAEGWRLYDKQVFAGLDLAPDIAAKPYDAVRLLS